MKPRRMPMGGGMPNMQSLMKQAQKMQEDMARLQEELEKREYKASAGGGMVTATVCGKKLTALTIDPEAVDPEDVEMLCDLVMAAVNEAMRQCDETTAAEMSKITGGSIPGLF